jgi:hypothetical protein
MKRILAAALGLTLGIAGMALTSTFANTDEKSKAACCCCGHDGKTEKADGCCAQHAGKEGGGRMKHKS